MNNSLKSLSNSALEKLKNFTPIYDEQWKYTSVNKFNKFDFDSELFSDNSKTKFTNKDNILLVNNILKNQSTITFDILSLKDAFNNNVNNCKNLFNQTIQNDKNQFILYNTAYFQNGNYFYFEEKFNQNEPIYIDNIIKQNNHQSFFNNRFLFHFGKGSTATIVLNESNDLKVLSNIVYELYLEEDANIQFIIDSKKPKTTQILNFGSIINKNACLKLFPIDISGKLIKNNYFINLNAKNSQFHYNGLNLLNNSDHIDNYIEVNHNNQYSTSHINHKNILNGKSKGIFYSKSTINNNGPNSEAHQNNNNLILSKDSIVHSNPQLMIYNNDVQCSHGSTTGEINDEALFYLRSRGIPLYEAKKVLLHAFLNDIIDSIVNEAINLNLKEKINSWINKYVN